MNVPLQSLIAIDGVDLPFFFTVGIRLCTILDDLHRRKLTHGTVSTAGVVVDDVTGAIELVNAPLTAGRSGAAAARAPGFAAYASPEQTGRMNRSVDYRTDMYSLGVTLYELLTGVLPFRSDDPLELIHAHLAMTPAPPSQIVASVPAPLSGIVLKLMAKAAGDRYQSALGLRHDLERAERAWTATAAMRRSRSGQQDVSDRFLISQKLYGRERELGRSARRV